MSNSKIWIMHTKCGRFYPIEPSTKCKPEDRGRLNDHVVRIEDCFTGEILWTDKKLWTRKDETN